MSITDTFLILITQAYIKFINSNNNKYFYIICKTMHLSQMIKLHKVCLKFYTKKFAQSKRLSWIVKELKIIFFIRYVLKFRPHPPSLPPVPVCLDTPATTLPHPSMGSQARSYYRPHHGHSLMSVKNKVGTSSTILLFLLSTQTFKIM